MFPNFPLGKPENVPSVSTVSSQTCLGYRLWGEERSSHGARSDARMSRRYDQVVMGLGIPPLRLASPALRSE